MDVFDLFAKLTCDTSDYEKKLNDAEKKGDGFGSKLSGIASGIGKAVTVAGTAIATAAAAGATAAGALVKSATEAYATYEQLEGGVAKLFGTGGKDITEYAKSVGKTVDDVKGDYDKLNLAQNMVMENASKAYETAGMSANEYMETVTGFSAALINSLEGDTVAAAEKADVALRAMSDNANTFGTDMEAISNAYAGFSKQNYTMLDNLKLGYGGTKQEMERLLADAEEYMATQGEMRDLSIDSYADIVDAIQAVQEAQGIAGTTAREASTTIEGSLAATKAAWDNLMTGLGDSDADIDDLISKLAESAGTAFGNILPVAENALTGVGTLIEKLLPKAVDEIPKIVNNVLPKLLKSGTNIVETLVKGIKDNLPEIVKGATNILNMLVNTIVELLPELLQVGLDVIVQLALGIAESLPELIPVIVDTMLTIVDTLLDNIDMIVDAAIAIILALTDGLIEALPKLIDKAPEIIIKLVKAFYENMPKIYKAGLDMIVKVSTALIDNLPKLRDAAFELIYKLGSWLIEKAADLKEKAGEIIDKIKAGLKAGISKIKDVGKNLIEGLWNGINDKVKWITDKVKGFGEKVIGSIKDIFGIHSPSRVFAQIRRFLAEGLGDGWEDESKSVIRQINDDMQFSANATLKTTNAVNERENAAYMSNLHSVINDAVSDALDSYKIEWNDRNLGRLVKTYA